MGDMNAWMGCGKGVGIPGNRKEINKNGLCLIQFLEDDTFEWGKEEREGDAEVLLSKRRSRGMIANLPQLWITFVFQGNTRGASRTWWLVKGECGEKTVIMFYWSQVLVIGL